jgi:5'-nucleotidase
MGRTILVTNDDGYESSGLSSLIKALEPLANIVVVAPSLEKSASSHSLTLAHPLRLISVDDNFYKLDDGTPADCIYMALHTLFKDGFKPDLVVSGINRGSNMGEDITYSGTVGGAMEGVLQGIPSIAVSQVCKDRCQNISEFGYEVASSAIADIVSKVFTSSFPLGERRLLNINIPPLRQKDIKGYKITKAGYRLYGNDAKRHVNPRGEEYYWLGTHPLFWRKRDSYLDICCDLEAIEDGYISITPIMLDLTSYEDIGVLRDWI